MFNFSVGYLTLTIYLLNAKPQYYWLLHTTVTAVFPIQYFLYKKEGWHYFMLEFCYSVSFFQMLFAIWALCKWMGYELSFGDWILMPVRWFYDGQMTMRVFYLLASGPVAWSSWLYSRALSFHDFKETLSFWMHISPAVVAYTLRWHQSELEASFPGILMYDVEKPVEPAREVGWAAMYYICVWAIPYYSLMCLLKDYLRSEGYKTLFHTECIDRMQHLSAPSRTIIYVASHFCAAMLGVIVSYVWWHYQFLNKLALSVLFMTAVYNGGKLYSERYSHIALELTNRIAPSKKPQLKSKN